MSSLRSRIGIGKAGQNTSRFFDAAISAVSVVLLVWTLTLQASCFANSVSSSALSQAESFAGPHCKQQQSQQAGMSACESSAGPRHQILYERSAATPSIDTLYLAQSMTLRKLELSKVYTLVLLELELVVLLLLAE